MSRPIRWRSIALLIFATIGVAVAALQAVVAAGKNRDPLGWFLLGLLFGLLSLVAVCALPPLPAPKEPEQRLADWEAAQERAACECEAAGMAFRVAACNVTAPAATYAGRHAAA
ncbi:hypothetical protein [Dactylosporangium sp. CS-033363]|uniref:hypothetical protein n=1 Tax=Dactylosporangium sp. CS-033363 TaxID=3239935 RepID=UPI003D8F000A